MAKQQFFGIKFPFSNESWKGSYLDLNETKEEQVRSEIIHIIFTPKGQRLRMPEFGTDFIKYVFDPNDSDSWADLKRDISEQITRYLPDVIFKDIKTFKDENNDNAMFALITYSVKNGNIETEYKFSVPIV